MSKCCTPGQPEGPERGVPALRSWADVSRTEMVGFDARTFLMGSESYLAIDGDGESPIREVRLSAYSLAAHAVTNREFGEFCAATGYQTTAEEQGASFVFAGLLPDDFPETRGAVSAPWWRNVRGACWFRPEGGSSDLTGRLDHPVVHVSWLDAATYALWAGQRLPTEAEWECAAWAGAEGATFPWGDDLLDNGEHRMNVWQGSFPDRNSLDDGFYGTCPVDAFRSNEFGMFNMLGNVWEWCADWFGNGWATQADTIDPKGPIHGRQRVVKGGSFLCHASYCARYRPSARTGTTPASSSSNTGFRCAADLPVLKRKSVDQMATP